MMYKNKIKISLSLLFLIYSSTFPMEKLGRKFLNGTLETTLKKKWIAQTLKTYKLYALIPQNKKSSTLKTYQLCAGATQNQQSFLHIAAISYLMPFKSEQTQSSALSHPPQLSAFGIHFEGDEIKLLQTKAFLEVTLSDLRKQGFKTVHMHKNIYEIFKAFEMEDYQDAIPLEEEPVVILPLEKVQQPSPHGNKPPPLPPRPSSPAPGR